MSFYSDPQADGRTKVINGLNKVAEIVTSTLGPRGRTVAINRPGMEPLTTKDGANVAANLSLQDHHENIGALMLKGAMGKVAVLAGDATTQTAQISSHLLTNVLDKNLVMRQFILELFEAREAALAHVDDIKIPVTEDDFDLLKAVATTSCNNNPVLGQVMAEIISVIGQNGVVHIMEAPNRQNVSHEIKRGYTQRKGVVNRHFLRNKNQDNIPAPLVFVTEDKLVETAQVLPILEKYKKVYAIDPENIRPLVIVCPSCSDSASQTILKNKDEMPIWVTMCDDFESLLDIAGITGAHFFGEDKGFPTKQSGKQHKLPNYFGECESVSVSAAGTTYYFEESKRLNDYIESVATDGERLAKLTKGVGHIYVGGATHAEIVDNCQLLEDAEGSCLGALKDGVLPGGAWAHLQLAEKLADIGTDGANALAAALTSVFIKLCQNSEVDPKGLPVNADNTFNFITLKPESIKTTKIIDSVPAIKQAIINSVALAQQVLNIGFTVINHQL
jgi:chaperonin GroEL